MARQRGLSRYPFGITLHTTGSKPYYEQIYRKIISLKPGPRPGPEEEKQRLEQIMKIIHEERNISRPIRNIIPKVSDV